MKFDLNSAIYLNGYWFDNDGNRITDSEYNKILSASTWGEVDPDLLELDDPGQIPYDDVIGDRDRADLNFYPEDMTFAEYVSGIKF